MYQNDRKNHDVQKAWELHYILGTITSADGNGPAYSK